MGDVSAKSAKLPIVTADGKLGYADAEDAAASIRAGAARAPTDAEYKTIKAQQKDAAISEALSTPGMKAAAFAMKAVDVTGLAKPLAQYNDKDTAEGIRLAEKYNPGWSTAGEVASFMAPMVAGKALKAASGVSKVAEGEGVLSRLVKGGAGMAQEGALPFGGFLPQNAVTGAGHAVERLTGRALGENVLSRIAGKAAGMGTETALLGAQHEFANQMSEESLGNHALNAEKILAAGGHDFMFGAALGGGLATAGEAFARARSMRGLMKSESLAEKASRVEGEYAYRAMGPTQGMAKDANRYFKGGSEELGRVWKADLESETGKAFAKLSREEAAEAVPKLLEKAGDKVGSVVKTLSAEAETLGEQPSFRDLETKIREKVIKPLEDGFGNKSKIAKVEEALGEMRAKVQAPEGASTTFPGGPLSMNDNGIADRVSLEQLHGWRGEMDKAWKGTRQFMPESSVYKDLRRVLEDEMLGRADALSERVGKSLKDDYIAAKRSYQAASMLDTTLERGLAQPASNAAFSLTSKMLGSAAGVAATAAGGGLLGGAISGGVAAMGTKLIQPRMGFVVSDIAGRLSKTLQASKALAEVSGHAESRMADLMGPSAATASERYVPPAVELFGRTSKEQSERVAQTTQALSNTSAIASHVERRLQPIAGELPKTSAAIAQQTKTIADYLIAKSPQPQAHPASIAPWLDKPTYRPDQVRSYAYAWKAATDPYSILDDAKRGTLRKEQVDAVQHLYPNLYDDMRERFHKLLMDPVKSKNFKSLPLQNRVQISTLFSIPYTLTDPAFLRDISPSAVGPNSASPTPVQPQRPSHSSPSEAASAAKAVQPESEIRSYGPD